MVDTMIDLEHKYGPFSARVWGLILNLIGNALMLYGAIGVFHNRSRLPIFIVGLVITVFCIVVLAKPSGKDSKEHSA